MSDTDELHPAVAAWLRTAGIDYEVLPCDPSLADTDVFCAHYGIDPRISANTLLIKAKKGETRYAACVLLAHTRLNVNADVRRRIGSSRVSFASAQDTLALTGMELGGVTPLGLPEGLPVWIDHRVMEVPRIVLGGGNRASKLKVSPRLFELMGQAEVYEDLAKEPPSPNL